MRKKLSRFQRTARLRPTMAKVLSAIFSMLEPRGATGLKILDLYAGSGSFGCEALRRGAARVDFVEKNGKRCSDIRKTLQRRGLEKRAGIYSREIFSVLPVLPGPYDVVFIDPPFRVQTPFVPMLERMETLDMFSPDCAIFIEHEKELDLPEEVGGLTIRAVKRYGDCKVTVYSRRYASEETQDSRSIPFYGELA